MPGRRLALASLRVTPASFRVALATFPLVVALSCWFWPSALPAAAQEVATARLDFPRSEMDGTVFEGQDKLKLVTPCHDSRGSYQEYVLKEYLVYKTLGILTPVANRVRLVEITYEDIEDDYDTRTTIAFLIESAEQMAARNGADLEEWTQFHPAGVSGD